MVHAHAPRVVFVAPFFMEATMRFVKAAADTPNVRLGVISQEPPQKLPVALRRKLASYSQVKDGLDPQQIANGVREIARDLGAVDRLLGTLEQLQVPLGVVRDRFQIPGLGEEVAANFRDKGRMKSILQNADIPCARHRSVTSSEAVHAFLEDVGFPVVVKPPAGAAAKDTFRLDDVDQMKQYLKRCPPSSKSPLLLEEFMTGEEHSFDSVCIGGRPVWYSVSRYYPTPLEVMESPWIQWCVVLPRELDRPEYQAIQNAGFRALDVLGMETGLSHMEWFLRPDGSVAISEVGARPPGAQFTTLISYAHDIDFYRAWAKLMIDDSFDVPQRSYACGSVFLRGQGKGPVQEIVGLEEVRRELGDVIVEAKVPREGQPQASSYEGEGYLILRHPDTRVVEQGLAKILKTVQIRLGKKK